MTSLTNLSFIIDVQDINLVKDPAQQVYGTPYCYLLRKCHKNDFINIKIPFNPCLVSKYTLGDLLKTNDIIESKEINQSKENKSKTEIPTTKNTVVTEETTDLAQQEEADQLWDVVFCKTYTEARILESGKTFSHATSEGILVLLEISGHPFFF